MARLFHRGGSGVGYLLCEVANVAQMETGHFKDGEQNHSGHQQGLVVSYQVGELTHTHTTSKDEKAQCDTVSSSVVDESLSFVFSPCLDIWS